MRLILLGDIHLYQLGVSPLALLGKRLIGQMNLWINRRLIFAPSLLPRVVERARSLSPDMVLLSGDLTTTALPGEFEQARKQLQPLLNGTQVVAVPGNHDRYTRRSLARRTMERVMGEMVPQSFPHTRELMPGWQLLALDAAVPTGLHSRGRLQADQLAGAGEFLKSLSPDQRVIVLCHYPVVLPPALPHKWQHGLDGAHELRDLLAECRAKLWYIHGHVHLPWMWQPHDPDLAHVTDINTGAPCLREAIHPNGQGFWVMDLPENSQEVPQLAHHCIEPSRPGGAPDSDGWVVTGSEHRQP